MSRAKLKTNADDKGGGVEADRVVDRAGGGSVEIMLSWIYSGTVLKAFFPQGCVSPRTVAADRESRGAISKDGDPTQILENTLAVAHVSAKNHVRLAVHSYVIGAVARQFVPSGSDPFY